MNNPVHYRSHPDGLECIQVTRRLPGNLANVVKYVWRVGLGSKGDPIESLEKAAWYLADEIAMRKADREKTR